jgi:hypothetical protein
MFGRDKDRINRSEQFAASRLWGRVGGGAKDVLIEIRDHAIAVALQRSSHSHSAGLPLAVQHHHIGFPRLQRGNHFDGTLLLKPR